MTECSSQVRDGFYGRWAHEPRIHCWHVNSSFRRGPAHGVERKEVKYKVPGDSRPREVLVLTGRSDRRLGGIKGAWLTEGTKEELVPFLHTVLGRGPFG